MLIGSSRVPKACFFSSRGDDELRSGSPSIEENVSNKNDSDNNRIKDEAATPKVYLHVGPSGDFWTNHNMFAAKHLQPDYVTSIPLDTTLICVDTLLDVLEEDENNGDNLARTLFDTKCLPTSLLNRIKKTTSNISQEEDPSQG